MSKYTNEQHQEAPKWLTYELTMLFNARSLHDDAGSNLQSATNEKDREYWRTVVTCALESFLVHYRNLKDFLNNLNYPTDVKAQDFASQFNGSANVVETYTNENQRINQLLAHVSYMRANLDRGNWDLATMEKNLRSSVGRFLDKVERQYQYYFDAMRNLYKLREIPSAQSVFESNSTATVQVFQAWWY